MIPDSNSSLIITTNCICLESDYPIGDFLTTLTITLERPSGIDCNECKFNQYYILYEICFDDFLDCVVQMHAQYWLSPILTLSMQSYNCLFLWASSIMLDQGLYTLPIFTVIVAAVMTLVYVKAFSLAKHVGNWSAQHGTSHVHL